MEPLHKTSGYGHIDVTRVLIEHGAKGSRTIGRYWTPMHLSARTQRKGRATVLDHGADANMVNDDGRSPHQLAVGKGPRVITDVLREPDYQRKCTLIIPIG